MVTFLSGDILTPNTDKSKYVAIISPMYLQGCAETKLQQQIFQEFPITFWTPSSVPYRTGSIKHSNLVPRKYNFDIINAYLFDENQHKSNLVDAAESSLLCATISAFNAATNTIRNAVLQHSRYTSMTVRIPERFGFAENKFPYDNWEQILNTARKIFSENNIHIEIWRHEHGKEPVVLE